MRGPLAVLILAAGLVPAAGAATPSARSFSGTIRIATFNCSLNRPTGGALLRSLSTPDDAQARAVAEIIQRVRPDILLLQEFDYDAAGASLAAFQANYLARPQGGARPIRYRHAFFGESNTGLPSGFDLDHDGHVGGGADALGFGEFPGQYAMVLLSRFPIQRDAARTFRKFLWRDMPGALLPDDAATAAPSDWYTAEQLALLPLSSKAHWDVPVLVGHRALHLLISHPTPPAFDGSEDRNGRRNHDEIRLWSDYLSGAAYLRDDAGRSGGFGGGDFVVMGDQNSDPVDGGSMHDAIETLIHHPRIDATFVPGSAGAPEASGVQAGANLAQRSDPRFDTADFNDSAAGNLRVDYLLPSKGLHVCSGGVFWPPRSSPLSRLVDAGAHAPPPSSDHRLVWIDVSADAARCPPGNDPTASAASRPGH